MRGVTIIGLIVGIAGCVFLAGGCVERKLTIVTNPAEAKVWLNDEEIGSTPVTTNFNWYGDYRIRVEKSGYAILNTHQDLKRPLHDRFPLDFIAECLWPGRIVDSYTWEFNLEPSKPIASEELIDKAKQAQAGFDTEINAAKEQVRTAIKEKNDNP